MDTLLNILVTYGYAGMFGASFLAGSIFPLSSEIVLVALQKVGLDSWLLILCATLGNTLGGVFNYGLGLLGKTAWIDKLLGLKDEKLVKARNFVDKYGPWTGFLSWIPFLGEALTVTLGLVRANPYITFFTILIGKFVRYLFIVGIIDLF